MRKSLTDINQNYEPVEESLDKKKEDKNISLISSQENPLICKSNCSFVNISSGISFKSKLFSLFTPIKNRKILMSSSNKNKGVSNSGKIYNISKNFIDNENYGNGKRKLLIDFNKSLINHPQLFNIASNNFASNGNNINPDLFTSPREKGSESDKKKEGFIYISKRERLRK